jgi:hypothetical protein
MLCTCIYAHQTFISFIVHFQGEGGRKKVGRISLIVSVVFVCIQSANEWVRVAGHAEVTPYLSHRDTLCFTWPLWNGRTLKHTEITHTSKCQFVLFWKSGTQRYESVWVDHWSVGTVMHLPGCRASCDGVLPHFSQHSQTEIVTLPFLIMSTRPHFTPCSRALYCPGVVLWLALCDGEFTL